MANETKQEGNSGALPENGKTAELKHLREHLERDVWPLIPPGELGRVLSREEEDQILGFGPDGY